MQRRPLTDAQGRVVVIVTSDLLEGVDGLPLGTVRHTEQLPVSIYHGDDGEDGDDD